MKIIQKTRGATQISVPWLLQRERDWHRQRGCRWRSHLEGEEWKEGGKVAMPVISFQVISWSVLRSLISCGPCRSHIKVITSYNANKSFCLHSCLLVLLNTQRLCSVETKHWSQEDTGLSVKVQIEMKQY